MPGWASPKSGGYARSRTRPLGSNSWWPTLRWITDVAGDPQNKQVMPASKRAVVHFVRVGFGVHKRHTCQVTVVQCSSGRCQSQACDQPRIRAVARTGGRAGTRRRSLAAYPGRREGWSVSHKRVERLESGEGVSIQAKHRQKQSVCHGHASTRYPPNERSRRMS